LVLLLNTMDKTIPQLYALRAFPAMSPEWTMLPLTAIIDAADEAGSKALEDEIERVIEGRFRGKPRDIRPGGKSPRELRLDRCRNRVNDKKPIFLTAP